MPLRSPRRSWGSSCGKTERDLVTLSDHVHPNPRWAFLISPCRTSSLSETLLCPAAASLLRFEHLIKGPSQGFSPRCPGEGLPRDTCGRKIRAGTVGSAPSVFPPEQKHVLTAGMEERADPGGVSKLGNVWSLLLKNTRQPSTESLGVQLAPFAACASVMGRGGATKGLRRSESPEKPFRK